jgi:hypothetical protein
VTEDFQLSLLMSSKVVSNPLLPLVFKLALPRLLLVSRLFFPAGHLIGAQNWEDAADGVISSVWFAVCLVHLEWVKIH